MKEINHIINDVIDGSIASEMGIETGDELIAINDETIGDIFDYQYLCENVYIEVLIRKKNGEEWLLEIDKDEDEDLGIVFDNGLMDEYHSCSNKCIFCFIDQMPKGMRDTLYFKDDDARLSFLQGNYITLTNMSDADIERIIKYNLSPINISFHTTNPKLRCMMLNNRFAGEALKKAYRLNEAGITMNGQIVLCKDVNDGDELERTLEDLYGFLPNLQSLSIVPVGVTKFREGLYEMKPLEASDAVKLIDCVEKWQKRAFNEYGLHWVHASDEWYINAGIELPEAERYDGYLQIANGVGSTRSLLDEAFEELSLIDETDIKEEYLGIVTGTLVQDYIKKICDSISTKFPQKHITVIPVKNLYFGETITVTGLLTGLDITNQCKNVDFGSRLLISENVLKADEDIFLDDMSLEEFKEILQVEVSVVQSNGFDLVDTILFESKD